VFQEYYNILYYHPILLIYNFPLFLPIILLLIQTQFQGSYDDIFYKVFPLVSYKLPSGYQYFYFTLFYLYS